MCVLRWFVLVPWCTVCLSTWLAVWDLILLQFTMWLAVRELILLQFAMLKWVSVCVCRVQMTVDVIAGPHQLTSHNIDQVLGMTAMPKTTYLHTHNRSTTLCPGLPGRPVPEETFTHSHPSWSLDILYQLPPFTAIHSILCVQFTCLTASLQVLFGLPRGLGPSTSYSMHFFMQSPSSFRSTCPYQQQLIIHYSETFIFLSVLFLLCTFFMLILSFVFVDV